jgi:hypothetical protein
MAQAGKGEMNVSSTADPGHSGRPGLGPSQAAPSFCLKIKFTIEVEHHR